VQDQKDRYAGISTYLEHAGLRYTVGFDYQEKGIRVQGKPFPILKMEWVDGDSLDKFVKEHRGNSHLLKHLAARWIRLVGDLEGAGVAHGDLQHGNVLVVGEDFKLIDYDGMYVPPFRGRFATSNELGDPNYQHPARANSHFDGRLDRFSTWIIYLSLIAFSEDPRLWSAVRAGEESLLLSSADLKQPDASSTIRLLLGRDSGETADLAREVVSLLAQPPLDVPSLAEKHGKPIGSGWLQDHVELKLPAPRPTVPAAGDVPDPEEHAPAQLPDNSWLASAIYLGSGPQAGPAAYAGIAEAPSGPGRAPLHADPGVEQQAAPVRDSSWIQNASDTLTPRRFGAEAQAGEMTAEVPKRDENVATAVSMRTTATRAARFGSWFAPFQLLAVLSLVVISVLAFVLGIPPHSPPLRWLALLPFAIVVNVAVALHAYLSDDALSKGRETRQQLAPERSALALLDEEIAATESALILLVSEATAETTRLADLRQQYERQLPLAIEEINSDLAHRLHSIDESLAQVTEMAEREISQVDINLEWVSTQLSRIETSEPDQQQKRLLVLQYQAKQDFVLKNDLSQATIPGVPGIICRRLFALGVRTARDLTYNRLETIPGIGEKYVQALMDWKRTILSAAAAQAPAALSAMETAAIHAEIEEKRGRLGEERQAAVQRRNAEMDGIRAQFAAETQRLQQERQEVNAAANRRIAVALDEHDSNRLDRECDLLRARVAQQHQELDDRLARYRVLQAEKTIRIGELEADAQAYSYLTFKRFLLRIYTTR
jgi:hypothetical protein